MKRLSSAKTLLINSVYFVFVFSVALAIATLALARTVNSYQGSDNPLIVSVEKPEIIINNAVTGQIDEILVKPGQFIEQGELMIKISDPATTQRLEALEALSTQNISARTEAEILRSRSAQYEIRAPKNGIVYKLNVAEGTYLSQNQPVITLFSDEDIRLVGQFNPIDYNHIQKEKNLDAYNYRFGQTYSLIFDGAGKVVPSTERKDAVYELTFRFADPLEGAAFIQGETLEITPKSVSQERYTPAGAVTKFWNSFIIGE